MSAIDRERDALSKVAPGDLEAYLLDHSNLPGPRGNLELLAAAVEVVPAGRLAEWATLSPEEAPGGTAREYLPVVGVTGIGRLLSEAGDGAERRPLLDALATHAADPRWRVREGVAMALQRFGAADFAALLDETRAWAASGERFRQRAAVAGLCEPPLLTDAVRGAEVLAILDAITETFVAAPDARSEPFRVLRQALGYGWSVAAVAAPHAGFAAMERWLGSPDRDVRWVMRENLKKNRLARLDPAWVAAAAQRIGL